MEMIAQQARVTPETTLPPMEHLFTMYGTPCFYRGEVVADCGKAKSGKTLFLSLVMSCAVRDSADSAERGEEPAIRRAREQPLRVLWIDTEQSAQSTQEILTRRILPVSGVQPERINERILAYNLRGYGHEARRGMVHHLITSRCPDLVVIDGIKDLVTDINDAVQATLVMEQLMALAQMTGSCIVSVLHMNKGEADKNMRGSIGTELTNKAFEVFQCEYLEEADHFCVKHAMSRRERCRRNMWYRLGDDVLPEPCEGEEEQPRDAQGRFMGAGAGTDNLRQLFAKAFEGRTQRPFGELMAVALRKCGVVDARAYYAAFREAEQVGIVRKGVQPGTDVTYVELCGGHLPF